MKKHIIVLITLLGFIGLAVAATLTIDIPANDVPRVQEAYGSILGLGRPATQAEVQDALKQYLIGSTKDYERRKNMVQFTPPPLEMQPTPTPTPTAGMAKETTPKATPKKK